MTTRRIVADVGGTRSRFGMSDGPGDLTGIHIYATAGHPSFADALAAYVADIGVGPAEAWCSSVFIAAAGPVDRGEVQLTNARWSISAREVSESMGGVPVTLVNDLEAVGFLLPHLQSADVAPVGGPTASELAGNRIAVNVGTGFGAATAVRIGGGAGWAVAAGEAGHMSLAPATPDEATVLGWGRTVEDILSGAGVGRHYAAHLAGQQDVAEESERTADAVFAAVAEDAIAAQAVQMLTRLLGRVAGDLVLATAAWDGVFLCGSVVHAWLEVADVRAFRVAFEDKGPMRSRMARVPTSVITAPEPALLGLSYADVPAV